MSSVARDCGHRVIPAGKGCEYHFTAPEVELIRGLKLRALQRGKHCRRRREYAKHDGKLIPRR